ncbi:hypothetical protein WICMUC_002130 [Wickerhamomyces mucosus]|uniref:Chromatin assembly factor 1 subunit A n=1 Tax=Wickerhamomyces mucosus TaxID=1378264 RepID=A0A9P8PQ51_9ASCO|nr:hypothetical protein WICMUC_002130 [Wickerhamomyces mucosus]
MSNELEVINIDDPPVDVIIIDENSNQEQSTPNKKNSIPSFDTKTPNTIEKLLVSKDSNLNTPTKPKTSNQLAKEEQKRLNQLKREKEKEERERVKEEEKKIKEEKRLQREEEKRKRDEEKERIKRENENKREQLKREKEERELKKIEERLKREAEKEAKKLEEERKKQEEETKKQKSMISNFFKPKSVIKSSIITNITKEDDEKNDYEKYNKFYIKENTSLYNFQLNNSKLIEEKSLFDSGINSNSIDSTNLKSFFQNQLNSIEIDKNSAISIHESNNLDAELTMKFIRFYENMKIYIGTFTKPINPSLALSPFDSNENSGFIDWDFEADEQEEGEGEDIEDDDEELDDELDEDEDLKDFLDEEEENKSSRKILGPLIPIVHWGNNNDNNSCDEIYKIEILKSNVSFPICPKTDYWSETKSSIKDGNSLQISSSLSSSSSPSSIFETQSSTIDQPKVKKPKSLITTLEDLKIFKQKVHGSGYTLPTMVEILKEELPKYTKSTIENTLKTLAKKVGPKPTERKWEIDETQFASLV